MGLKKALLIEKALAEANEKGLVGTCAAFNPDGAPCCVVGHACAALGIGPDRFYRSGVGVPVLLGALPENAGKMATAIWKTQRVNDGDIDNDPNPTLAAQILVEAVKTYCDDEGVPE